MEAKLPDRWHSRDLPVLLQAARGLDAGDSEITSESLSRCPDLQGLDVVAACRALTPAFLVSEKWESLGGPTTYFIEDLTERGRRTVGLWPSGENVDALVDALKQAEEATDDPEEKSAIRRAAGAVLGVGRDVMTDVMAAVIAKQMGM